MHEDNGVSTPRMSAPCLPAHGRNERAVHLRSLVRSGVVESEIVSPHDGLIASAGEQNKGGGTVGAISSDAINWAPHTSAGSRERASDIPDATAQAGAPHVGANAINKAKNKKRFPSQSRVRDKGNPSGPVTDVGIKHTPTPLGPYYGGGRRR